MVLSSEHLPYLLHQLCRLIRLLEEGREGIGEQAGGLVLAVTAREQHSRFGVEAAELADPDGGALTRLRLHPEGAMVAADNAERSSGVGFTPVSRGFR